jgi:methyl-accepting chemotaxis protein
MNRFTISFKLSLLIGLMAMLLLVIGGIGLYGINKGDQALQTVYAERTVPITQLAEIQSLQLRTLLTISTAQLDAMDETTAAAGKLVAGYTQQINDNWAKFSATPMSDANRTAASAYWDLQTKYLRDAIEPTLKALQDNDLFSTSAMMRDKARPMFEVMRERSNALMQHMVEGTHQDYESSRRRNQVIRSVSVASIVGGLLVAAVLGFNLMRGITVPLGHAVSLANAVAAGNLSQTIPQAGSDEISALMRALARMQDGLVGVVSSVRKGAHGVATACTEIAQGNHDLSTRTEHQASALEETAASMEELNSTVSHNADSAREANQLALRASSIATEGGEVVGQVVKTMHGINDSSRKIADIISVIDGIAFQTNILALNAAVEAARAGEQGRGFAVVASEVRSLAGRSAEAAKEIKNLIGESVARVEQGSVLVDKAGSTMTEVVASIRRVADIVGEISSASSEQSAGVAQIGGAITQMDRVTQQNAALVEEMAAAASSLQNQAQDLVGSVSVFTLATADAKPASPITPQRTALALGNTHG